MSAETGIRVQQEPFEPGAELTRFSVRNSSSGAICTFTGQMRDFRGSDRATGEPITAMELDHYPGMAERQLAELAGDAKARWPLDDLCIIHRFGKLNPTEPIVFVATASSHRGDAFAAAEFLMDWLKTKAPFWKKEATAKGAEWVSEAAADVERAQRWTR